MTSRRVTESVRNDNLARVERAVSNWRGGTWAPERAAVAARRLYPRELVVVPDHEVALYRAVIARAHFRGRHVLPKPGLGNVLLDLVGLAAQRARVREQAYEVVDEELFRDDSSLTPEQWRLADLLGTAEDCVRYSTGVALALENQIGELAGSDIHLARETGDNRTLLSAPGVWVSARLNARGVARGMLRLTVGGAEEGGPPSLDHKYALVPELALALVRLPAE
jgi:hypothetical protein